MSELVTNGISFVDRLSEAVKWAVVVSVLVLWGMAVFSVCRLGMQAISDGRSKRVRRRFRFWKWRRAPRWSGIPR